MKKAFLLIVVPALLVALGFAQTPGASIKTDQTNIKGCLGGSDGNYTVADDNTGHIFKITTSSVDLKAHLGHDVTLIGHKASVASSGAAGDSLDVTELNMISERCAAAAASTAPVSTPSETASIPAATAASPAATAASPPAPVSTPSETASITAATAAGPAAPGTASAETAVTPAVAEASRAATASTSSETASTTDAAAAHPTRPRAHPRTLSTPAVAASPAASASTPSETASTPDAAATKPAVTGRSPSEIASSESASTPAAAATKPAATTRSGSLWILISVAVLVIVIGTMAPLIGRWKRRKLLERSGAQNLSFNAEASSDLGKSDQPVARKAA